MEISKVMVTGNQEQIRDVQVKITVEGKEEEQQGLYTLEKTAMQYQRRK